jgi:hypothetical protein
MPHYLTLEGWLAVIKKEYLQEFVHEGGAAVKFIVPVDCTEPLQIKTGLQHLAEEEGFLYVPVDATTVKIHLIEQIFFQVAGKVDWDDTVYLFLRSLLQEHYKLPESRNDFSLKQIALLNGYEEREIRLSVNNRLREALFRDYAMTQEFRIAMLTLCRCLLDPDEITQNLCISLKEWLKGELRLISALKPALIFQKIGRHNARNLLFSLTHWLRLSGKNGLVLLLDIARYTQERPRERDETLYYSTAAVLDCYELLRQFIDGCDEAAYFFTAVIAPARFLDESDRRSVSNYDALKMRIWDEIHDKEHVNPLSALLRVSSCRKSPE